MSTSETNTFHFEIPTQLVPAQHVQQSSCARFWHGFKGKAREESPEDWWHLLEIPPCWPAATGHVKQTFSGPFAPWLSKNWQNDFRGFGLGCLMTINANLLKHSLFSMLPLFKLQWAFEPGLGINFRVKNVTPGRKVTKRISWESSRPLKSDD